MHQTALLVLAAVALDAMLGEPKRWHPLAGFGWLASQIERILNRPFNSVHPEPVGELISLESTHTEPLDLDCNRDTKPCAMPQRILGVLAICLLLLPAMALSWVLEQIPHVGPLASLLGLYLALGARSLAEHGRNVAQPLASGDMARARYAVSRIVSRDTANLSETGIATATAESMLENGCDAIFGALFWFCIAGLPGAVVYRLTNTLDAMWGYRNERYRYFGWAAARLDDGLNYIPARLTALAYTLCGHSPTAIKAWRCQAPTWKSPNAGPVMAAGAGALHLQLGGSAVYHGVTTERPDLGYGALAQAHDINRAINLVQRSLWLWLAVISLIGLMNA